MMYLNPFLLPIGISFPRSSYIVSGSIGIVQTVSSQQSTVNSQHHSGATGIDISRTLRLKHMSRRTEKSYFYYILDYIMIKQAAINSRLHKIIRSP
jgi:hypothetical protein